MTTITNDHVIRAAARLVIRGRVDRARALDLLCAAEMAVRGSRALGAAATAVLDARLEDALQVERDVAWLAGEVAEFGHCSQ